MNQIIFAMLTLAYFSSVAAKKSKKGPALQCSTNHKVCEKTTLTTKSFRCCDTEDCPEMVSFEEPCIKTRKVETCTKPTRSECTFDTTFDCSTQQCKKVEYTENKQCTRHVLKHETNPETSCAKQRVCEDVVRDVNSTCIEEVEKEQQYKCPTTEMTTKCKKVYAMVPNCERQTYETVESCDDDFGIHEYQTSGKKHKSLKSKKSKKTCTKRRPITETYSCQQAVEECSEVPITVYNTCTRTVIVDKHVPCIKQKVTNVCKQKMDEGCKVLEESFDCPEKKMKTECEVVPKTCSKSELDHECMKKKNCVTKDVDQSCKVKLIKNPDARICTEEIPIVTTYDCSEVVCENAVDQYIQTNYSKKSKK